MEKYKGKEALSIFETSYTETMLTLNYKKEFSSILILASIINNILALIMVPILKHIGISLSVLLSEIFVTFSMIYFLNKKGIKIIGAKLV